MTAAGYSDAPRSPGKAIAPARSSSKAAGTHVSSPLRSPGSSHGTVT
jgi:hypothetical protein